MFDTVIRDLDARRIKLGLTKADLARQAELPAAGVRRLFSQQQKNPTLTTLIAIADALGLQLRLSAPTSPAAAAPRDSERNKDVRKASIRASETQRRTA